MESTINERFVFLLGKLQMNETAMAKIVNCSRQSLQKITKNKNAPRYETLYKVSLYIPHLNVRWLITGEGDMFDIPDEELDFAHNRNLVFKKPKCDECIELEKRLEEVREYNELLKENLQKTKEELLETKGKNEKRKAG